MSLNAKSRLHLLLVEDSEDDAALVLRHLSRAGYDVTHKRVETEDKLREALSASTWDVVLSDYVLPRLSGLRAIRIVRETHADLPVILLSGKIGEETAVAAMRAGAQDYLMKDSLARLAPAVERELAESQLRRSHRAASAALRESQELFRRIVETTNEGILTTSTNGDIVFANQRLASILGVPREALLATSLTDAIRDRLLPPFPDEQSAASMGSRNDVLFQTQAGRRLWLSTSRAPLYERDGRFLGTLFLYSDITARKEMEERLRHETLHDSLTGLANLTLLRDRIDRAILRQQRQPAPPAALLLVDLDRFRAINDSLGHAAGDRILIEVARRLKHATHAEDTVARHNADEFGVLLEGVKDSSDASHLASALHSQLAQTLTLETHELVPTASVGMVLLHGQYKSAEDVLRDADAAMYRAKSMGRGAVVAFHESMRAGVTDRLHLETDLRRAILNGELRIHYQPIFHLDSGAIDGVEALVRWQHPLRGLLLPREFLPLASEIGVAADIDLWVLHNACRQVVAWRERLGGPDLKLWVNCAGERFASPASVEAVIGSATSVGLPLSALRLEVVEEEIATEPDSLVEGIRELKRHGIGIIVDDFGTGYSSLDRVSRLPVTGLKIAGSFFTPGDEHFRVVSTILQLAQDLGLRVVAEGVETRPQAERLRRMRCDYAQGFCFSAPLVAEVAEVMIVQRRLAW